MHEMQNRMKIAFCVKPPLLSLCLRIKEAPVEVFGERGGSVGLAPALASEMVDMGSEVRAAIKMNSKVSRISFEPKQAVII